MVDLYADYIIFENSPSLEGTILVYGMTIPIENIGWKENHSPKWINLFEKGIFVKDFGGENFHVLRTLREGYSKI